MRLKDLTVGDLVMFDDKIHKLEERDFQYMCRGTDDEDGEETVMYYKRKSEEEITSSNMLDDDFSFWYKHKVNPIPLTYGFLTENKFEHNDENGEWKKTFDSGVELLICFKGWKEKVCKNDKLKFFKEWTINVSQKNKGVLVCIVTNIHELQKALRFFDESFRAKLTYDMLPNQKKIICCGCV